MPLTKQGDELVHAVAQGSSDEAKAGCVTVDQAYISTGAFNYFLRAKNIMGITSIQTSL